jgi:hypothetical protein
MENNQNTNKRNDNEIANYETPSVVSFSEAELSSSIEVFGTFTGGNNSDSCGIGQIC